MSKVETILLSNRNPVKVNKGEWPCVASASDYDGPMECQANRVYELRVRQKADRVIVYGWFNSNVPVERDLYAGYFLKTSDMKEIATAIRQVASEIDAPSLAADCIQDLPAEQL